ncbi:MAG: class I SAM-dependent RNA methyltransferase [Chthoniobacterales bacterium]
MKKSAELLLEITDIAYGGAGLGRHEGRVVFVPFTIPGETVRVRINRVHRSWLEGEVREIVLPSPDRLAPPCPWFGRCGGCAYQHIAYPRQLEIKTRQVAEALRRIGKLPAPPVEPAQPSPLAYGYRNRLTLHVEPPLVGFRGTDPRHLVDIGRCLLADETVNEALAQLRGKRWLHPGPATLRSSAHGGGFRQVNDGAAEVLAGVVADLAGQGEVLVDAYCGGGFFAKKLLGAFARVIGLDWDARAIAAAQDGAQAGEEYRAGDTAALLPALLRENSQAVVLLDPPAQGLAPEVVEVLVAARPPRIIYVSCDPATLARDLAKLAVPHPLKRVIPVDMFPQTAAIETVCLLEA